MSLWYCDSGTLLDAVIFFTRLNLSARYIESNCLKLSFVDGTDSDFGFSLSINNLNRCEWEKFKIVIIYKITRCLYS